MTAAMLLEDATVTKDIIHHGAEMWGRVLGGVTKDILAKGTELAGKAGEGLSHVKTAAQKILPNARSETFTSSLPKFGDDLGINGKKAKLLEMNSVSSMSAAASQDFNRAACKEVLQKAEAKGQGGFFTELKSSMNATPQLPVSHDFSMYNIGDISPSAEFGIQAARKTQQPTLPGR